MNKEDKLYHEILGHVLKLLSRHESIDMIASCLMIIAQRLYRTHLSEKDYKTIMKVATEVEVQPYDIRKGTLH
jgi:hypothetical protein|tara:strand:- start:13 stop:231 length:219 start_codon:yes stop_codon:yes gene_type:complete